MRQMTFIDVYKNFWDVRKKMRFLLQNVIILKSIRNSLIEFPNSIQTVKAQSSQCLRKWAEQCECMITYKLRRGKVFCLYAKLWEEYVFKDFLNRMKRQMSKYHTECIIFNAVGLAAYNWDVNRIPDADVLKYKNELDYIRILREKTICSKSCLEKNKSSRGKKCECYANDDKQRAYDDWIPFIKQKDLIVWRRLHSSGHYEYKVYGSYNDVNAMDFLNVQIDADYRRSWDNTAISLEVIEKDPNPTTNSDVVYWEMLWPKLFANRDYVFKRRYIVDNERKTVIVVSKATDHPSYPAKHEKYRVKDYWSYMVIKPYKELNKPGIEFGLTYFDNPGVNIPSSVTTWVSIRAMPEFLGKLREAAKKYKDYCKREGSEYKCNFVINNENNADTHNFFSDKVFDDMIPKIQCPSKLNDDITLQSTKEKYNSTPFVVDGHTKTREYISDAEVIISPSPMIQADSERQNYWQCLHPAYYFS